MPPAGSGSGLAGDAGDGDPAGRQTSYEPAHSVQEAGARSGSVGFQHFAICLWPGRTLGLQVRGRFLPGGGRATTRCTGSQGGTAGRGTYSRPAGTAWQNRADSRLIHSRRTPQSRAVRANYGYSPTEAVPNHSPHPQHDGRSAAVRAGSSAGIVSNGSPGSHTRRVRPSSPRSNPFHGLDGIEDTRARHDAPSPGPSAPRAMPQHRATGHATQRWQRGRTFLPLVKSRQR